MGSMDTFIIALSSSKHEVTVDKGAQAADGMDMCLRIAGCGLITYMPGGSRGTDFRALGAEGRRGASLDCVAARLIQKSGRAS